MLFSLFLACGDKSHSHSHSHSHDEEDIAHIQELDADLEKGEELYSRNCSGCHGVNAEGGNGPELVGEDLGHFVHAIQEGSGSMPAFPDLTDQDIADIYGYVQSL